MGICGGRQIRPVAQATNVQLPETPVKTWPGRRGPLGVEIGQAMTLLVIIRGGQACLGDAK